MLTFAGLVTANYDKYLGPLNFDPFARDLVSRIDKSSVQNVLEIACGTGRLTRQLNTSLPDSVEITSSDLSMDMLDFAKNLLPDKRIHFIRADSQNLPMEDESFDLVICQFGYMFAQDKSKAFREAFRVLKKGGVLLFNTWDKLENNKIRVTMRKILDDFFERKMDFLDVPFCMCDPNAITVLLSDAGFSHIECLNICLDGVSPTALDAATGLIKGNPIYKEILEKDRNAPEKLIYIAEQEIARIYGNHPVKCKLSAWVTSAVKA